MVRNEIYELWIYACQSEWKRKKYGLARHVGLYPAATKVASRSVFVFKLRTQSFQTIRRRTKTFDMCKVLLKQLKLPIVLWDLSIFIIVGAF